MLSSLTIVTSKPDTNKSTVTDQGRVDMLLCAPFYVKQATALQLAELVQLGGVPSKHYPTEFRNSQKRQNQQGKMSGNVMEVRLVLYGCMYCVPFE